jgi:serine phosphatase RsbU (regulator of sigma subunit)
LITRSILATGFFCCFIICLAQESASRVSDTAAIRQILSDIKNLKATNPDSALALTLLCTEGAQKLNSPKQQAEAGLLAAGIYLSKGNTMLSEKFALASLQLYRSVADSLGVAGAFNTLGRNSLFLGKFPEALSSFISALKLFELSGDKKNAGFTNVNIGRVFLRENNFKEAMKYYETAMKLFEQCGETRGRHIAYSSLGYIYEQQKDYNTALNFNYKCLDLYTQDGDKVGIAGICSNIGFLKAADGSVQEGVDYAVRAVNLYKEIGNKEALAGALNNLGSIFLKKKDFIKADNCFREALQNAKETGNKEEVKNAFLNLSLLNNETGDFKKAYSFHTEYSAIKDSIFTEENENALSEIRTRFETEKKEREIVLLQKDKELDREKLENKNTVIMFVVVGLILLVFSLLLLFNRYQLKTKTNTQLRRQNVVIEKKNKDITDSISYAKRIQEAFLPSVKEIEKALNDVFILYLPKDIVSGDFYWFHKENDKIFIAVADCTGHGVPGALMSMIGHDELNHIVIEKKIHSPGEILSLLNRNVKQSLKQEEQEGVTRDGLDIALICLQYTDATRKTAQLNYSGAQRPLLICRNNNPPEELKADKCSIAGFTDSGYKFEEHSLQLSSGDAVYLFSDGYADQFGGEKGKKFKYRKLLQLLNENSRLPMKDQQNMLRNALKNWMEKHEQLDDVCVCGVRI